MSRKSLNRYLTLLILVSSSFKAAHAIELTWGGFGSMFYAQALSKDLQAGGFADRHADFTHFSLFGLNANAKLTPEWTAALQIIATAGNPGADPNNHLTEWAYVNYAPAKMVGLNLRLGRQRYPSWSAAEYINTHFQLPYRAVPSVVYTLSPFTSFDGISVGRDWQFGIARLNVTLFGGAPELDGNSTLNVETKGSDLIGGKVSWDGDGWRVRAQASIHSLDASVNNNGQPVTRFGGHVQDYSVGYRYDKFRLLSWGEYIAVKSNDGRPVTAIPVGTPGLPYGMPGGTFARSQEAGYVLFGYHVGEFTPRYTFASSNSGAGYRSGTVQSHTFGVNYQVNANVLARAEFEIVKSHNNMGDTGVTRPNNNADATGNQIYAGIDFIF